MIIAGGRKGGPQLCVEEVENHHQSTIPPYSLFIFRLSFLSQCTQVFFESETKSRNEDRIRVRVNENNNKIFFVKKKHKPVEEVFCTVVVGPAVRGKIEFLKRSREETKKLNNQTSTSVATPPPPHPPQNPPRLPPYF